MGVGGSREMECSPIERGLLRRRGGGDVGGREGGGNSESSCSGSEVMGGVETCCAKATVRRVRGASVGLALVSLRDEDESRSVEGWRAAVRVGDGERVSRFVPHSR
jgi:hypothetical protein